MYVVIVIELVIEYRRAYLTGIMFVFLKAALAILNAKLEELRILENTLADHKKTLSAQQDYYE